MTGALRLISPLATSPPDSFAQDWYTDFRTRPNRWAWLKLGRVGCTTMKRVLFGATAVFSTGIYMLLCIWGYGSWTGYFSDSARSWLVFVAMGLAGSAAFTDSSGLNGGVREDKSNRWVLIPLIVAGFLMPWLCAYLDRHDIWVLGGETERWIGLAVCLAGGALRIAPVFILGRRFSGLVAIQPHHTLKTDGLYRYIRHPSYLGLIICAFGWALVFRCLVPGLVVCAVLLAPLIARMNSEEKLLTDQFGEEYVDYKKRTWRLVPGVY